VCSPLLGTSFNNETPLALFEPPTALPILLEFNRLEALLLRLLLAVVVDVAVDDVKPETEFREF
jgi:hypothetical protein